MNLKVHMKMEGLPKHWSWNGPKLASIGLHAVRDWGQAFPGRDTLGTSAGDTRPLGQLEQDRSCASPCTQGAHLPVPAYCNTAVGASS